MNGNTQYPPCDMPGKIKLIEAAENNVVDLHRVARRERGPTSMEDGKKMKWVKSVKHFFFISKTSLLCYCSHEATSTRLICPLSVPSVRMSLRYDSFLAERITRSRSTCNTYVPVSSSYIKMPSDQKSTALSWP